MLLSLPKLWTIRGCWKFYLHEFAICSSDWGMLRAQDVSTLVHID